MLEYRDEIPPLTADDVTHLLYVLDADEELIHEERVMLAADWRASRARAEAAEAQLATIIAENQRLREELAGLRVN